MERVRHQNGHDHGGRDGKQPRDHAMAMLAGIEMAFERAHVALEGLLERIAQPQGTHLLEQKRRQ